MWALLVPFIQSLSGITIFFSASTRVDKRQAPPSSMGVLPNVRRVNYLIAMRTVNYSFGASTNIQRLYACKVSGQYQRTATTIVKRKSKNPIEVGKKHTPHQNG